MVDETDATEEIETAAAPAAEEEEEEEEVEEEVDGYFINDSHPSGTVSE